MTPITKALLAFTFAIAAFAMMAPLGALGEAVQDMAVLDGPYETTPESDLIVIAVPEADLQRCIASLDAVFMGPVVDAQVQTASLSLDKNGPTVRCVVES
ncbi:hypothetical protein [Celeribacter sp. ULVN23_4]